MTLEPKDRRSISDIRMERAHEFLADAEANFREGRLKTSVNRSYYAALNAARSVLILEGANPETHEGTITMLSLRFIKPGLLPVDIIRSFKSLLARRTDVDYGDFETVNSPDVEDSIRIARNMIEVVDALRKKMISQTEKT